ncbi:MAG TPA: hypothetical protein VHV54_28300 [Candidatus Binatia bacterium]|nr:hypothetical protein [Candidatus Binatia bacterium]
MNIIELVKRMIEQAPGYYARALRVIGQDLADLFPENLAIELQGDKFVANGMCSKNRVEDPSVATPWTGLKRIGEKLVTRILKTRSGEPDLEFVQFSRTYNAQDIDRLDIQGTKNRNSSGMPDIYSLGERLRTIGKVIDAHNGRIVRVFKDLHQVVYEYQDGDGKARKEELNNTELYQLQQRYAAERGGSNPA